MDIHNHGLHNQHSAGTQGKKQIREAEGWENVTKATFHEGIRKYADCTKHKQEIRIAYRAHQVRKHGVMKAYYSGIHNMYGMSLMYLGRASHLTVLVRNWSLAVV